MAARVRMGGAEEASPAYLVQRLAAVVVATKVRLRLAAMVRPEKSPSPTHRNSHESPAPGHNHCPRGLCTEDPYADESISPSKGRSLPRCSTVLIIDAGEITFAYT